MSVAGIDIGNDTSCVALARKRGIDVILNKESKRETPSVISFGSKRRSIGTDGLAFMATNMRNTIYQVKRLIGKKFNRPDVQADIAGSPFDITEGPDGGCVVNVDYLGERAAFTPEQLMAMLLLDQKEIAEKDQEGLKITDCVIAVPAYFDEAERLAMLDAAKLSGLNCLRLLNENTATALSYGIYKTDLPEDEPVNVAFVDMGHSSLQASIVAFKKGQLRVLTHTWDKDVGGRDFDNLILDYFAAEWKTSVKLDVKANKKATHRALLQIEKLKKMLSANPEAPLNIECLMDDTDVRGMLHRDKVEELAAPLMERVRATLEAALAQAGLTPEQIAAVEVIGSATRTPAVANTVRDVFKREPSRTLNAKECVSRGCALYCAMVSPLFRVRDFEVADAIPLPVACTWESKDKGTMTSVLFPRNAEHAPSKSKIVTFLRSEPFEIKAVYAEDAPLAQGASRELGAYRVGPFAVPAGAETATIKVQFKLDAHGIHRVESAYLEEKIEEPADEAEASAAGDAASAGNGDAPKTRTKVRKTEVPVSSLMTRGVAPERFTAFLEAEAQMALTDRIQEETAERKNNLEAYVYDMRNKLSGVLSGYVAEDAKAEFSRRLDAMENWLYDEGEDCEKKVYVERMDELRKHGDPIVRRFQEAEGRGEAARRLRSVCENYIAEARSTRDVYAHIEQADKDRVLSECQSALKWLEEKLQQQDKSPKNVDPVVTVSDISRKAETVERVCRPIMSKPVPKKEEPKKQEAAKGNGAAAENSEPMEADGPEEGPEAPPGLEMDTE